MKKWKIIGFLSLLSALFIAAILFKENGAASRLLWSLSNGGQWLLPLIFVSALIDSVNPCAFSILLLTIAFLFSIGKLRSKILQIGVFYILGIFLVYVLIGLGILQTLHLFNTPHFMAKASSLLLIALGAINVINEFFPSFPIKLKIPSSAHHKMSELAEKASLPSAFLLGTLVGLCEFPCTGGPYLMVLGFLHDKETYIRGLGYLILYNLIFILPLVIILLLAGNKRLALKIQEKHQKDKRFLRLWGGIGMVILGLFILLI